ncbi:hypothetical protein, partial [Brevundimonas sp.]|uniref:hypothetical protein n=1 Tax=Brevundimonas sp. TaxID=1871086 RepID=UPI003D6D1A06
AAHVSFQSHAGGKSDPRVKPEDDGYLFVVDVDATIPTELATIMDPIFLDLIDAVRQGTMSVSDFASAVENEWNFGTERAALSEHERASLQKLFDVVVYYSPYPEERARIPNYRDENDVMLAAQICREALQSSVA